MEPWLRGTLREVPAVGRAVIHALELAVEDARKWCGELSDAEMEALPAGLPSVGFQLRHMAGSVDRLLTYAEGGQLNDEQMEWLASELTARRGREEMLAEFTQKMAEAIARVRVLGLQDLGLQDLGLQDLEAQRFVGRKRVATSLGGLLVHVAEHTARHVGQMVSTANLLLAVHESGDGPLD